MITKAPVCLNDEAQTLAFGAALYPHLARGAVIYLLGGLGAGKTTLVRGLVKAALGSELAAKTEVPSPTFGLIQSFEVMGMDGAPLDIHHLDLYRLSHEEEAYELGVFDMCADAISFIEWPQRLGRLGFEDRLDIHIDIITHDKTQSDADPTTYRLLALKPQGAFVFNP